MEEVINRGDLHVKVVRQSSLRPGGNMKSTLSGRSTPNNSPTFRRLHSSRTPRREGRSVGGSVQWFRSNRLVYWLLLITLWAYLGFYVQSRWAHGDNKEEFLGFGGKTRSGIPDTEQNTRQDLLANDSSMAVNNGTNKIQIEEHRRIGVVLAKSGNKVSSKHNKVSSSRKRKDRVLEWSPEKRTGTCDRKGNFARLVWSRKFVLIFHELSMTGAPLSMMELATEFLSCGATVSAVVLSKRVV
ncbi:hypothetical protein GH714_034564 [Hevea brasiliensis]|uniref:Uncharacterized protein n=1 Tax=Hevea brasiliensis TaxID=3981 RepID=A0A6A6NAT7_HEVBR|nr:hypothetical protein GH714_034564 [Hevea brasiliensis]